MRTTLDFLIEIEFFSKSRTVRLKFYLNQADIYAFWISAWQTGESGGYTGGGGPGLSDEGIDTPMDKLKNN